MGSILGTLFRVATWGESHGGGVGVVVDGCPPGLPLTVEDVQRELDRRRPGQSSITSPRQETDQVRVLSGLHEGHTLGTPIAMNVDNQDARPQAYAAMQNLYRPSHADYTYQMKYGRRMAEGGGRSSARETIGRVAAGAIAKKILHLAAGVEITAWVESVHQIAMPELADPPRFEQIEATPIRCPHPETAARMIALIEAVRAEGDSVGGVIRCSIRHVPPGLGDPVFDRLEADLAKAMLSLPATKGFEIGSGFAGTLLKGSAHNDLLTVRDGRVRATSNRSGGVQGGISNGEEIDCRIAFKPTATILRSQTTVTMAGEPTQVQGRGRHDPCVLPRAVPIVEAMAALVLVDHWMRQQGQNHSFDFSRDSMRPKPPNDNPSTPSSP